MHSLNFSVSYSPSVAKDQHSTCKSSEVLHSDVVTNGVLNTTRNRTSFKFLGHVKNMKGCLGLCCAYKKCELAYLENNTMCFSTKCDNPESCRISRSDQLSRPNDTQISLMVKKESEQKGKINASMLTCS